MFYLAFMSLTPVKALRGGAGELRKGVHRPCCLRSCRAQQASSAGETASCTGEMGALLVMLHICRLSHKQMAFCWRCRCKLPRHIVGGCLYPQPHWRHEFASTSALAHPVSCKPGVRQSFWSPLLSPGLGTLSNGPWVSYLISY